MIAFVINAKFNKYIFDIERAVMLPDDCIVAFNDLDNDGLSEKITSFDQENATGITVRKYNDDLVGQWNFKGTFNFFSKHCLYLTGDKDNNGSKEIYAFTLSNDSVILHCIPDSKDLKVKLKDRFITRVGLGLNSADPFIIPAEMDDLDNDKIKELIFGIGTGFSVYPRNVYAYFIKKDSLISSPASAYYIARITQMDINNDGKKEIIPSGYATGNVKPDAAKYHDYSNYLMVLGQDLNFLFEPIEFKGENSILTPFINLKENYKESSLNVLFTPPSNSANSLVYSINASGVVIDSLKLPFHAVNCYNTSTLGNNAHYLITSKIHGLGLYNEDFELLRSLPGKDGCLILQNNIDKKGGDEVVLIDFERSDISVFDENLKKSLSVKFLNSGYSSSFISFIENSNSLISFQSGRNHFIFNYRKNPYYPYFYLFYPGIYLGILGFVLVIKSVQKSQLKKKYDTEKKITQLQLALIKNQLDPHFTLNAMNSVLYSVENSDKLNAGAQLRRFSNLYRSLLYSADSVQRTIQEELDFCKNYLELEKARFGEKFEYFISLPDNINKEILIPKLLIQLYVENAVKHGLAALPSGGKLEISFRNEGADLIIEILDNGVGRKTSESQIKHSTGKGLSLMTELCSAYNKYFNESISPEIEDLYNNEGQPKGTRVSIRIEGQNEKR